MRFKEWKKPTMEENKPTKYNWIVQNVDKFKLGNMTDIGSFTYINAKYGVILEDFVQIGSHCSIYSVSTIDHYSGTVTLKRNCRIGTHSTIMPGVTIGENSIIGAYSLVKSDIPHNCIAYGVPTRYIRDLNPEELISLLDDTK